MERALIVTGARPGGIGHAVAERFALQERDSVLLCDKEAEAGLAVVEGIRRKGGRIELVVANVTDPRQVDQVMDAIRDRLGRLDVVVNNAGGAGSAPARDKLAELTLERLVELFIGNVGSPSGRRRRQCRGSSFLKATAAPSSWAR